VFESRPASAVGEGGDRFGVDNEARGRRAEVKVIAMDSLISLFGLSIPGDQNYIQHRA
jgi:hypothetical protein